MSLHWLGIASGPIAWALSTQINYALAGTGHGSFPTVPIIAVVLAVIALGGGAASWRNWRRTSEPVVTPATGIPRIFLAGIGSLSAILFAAVILLQGTAGLILR